MTVRINFLPRSYQPPRQVGVREWSIAAAAAVFLVAGGTVYASAFATAARTERQVEAAQAQLQGVRSLLAQAGDLRLREERVAQTEAELQALTGQQWSGVLLTLRDLTPRQVTWVNLQAEADTIILDGVGTGLVDVAQLFAGLVDHPRVAEASLRYVNEEGLPITVTVRIGDDDDETAQKLILGTYRQIRFQMVISLVEAEGRQIPRGA